MVIGDNAFDTIADLAGPSEPNIARIHMPDSIRALYGIDQVRNCIWWSKNEKTYKRIFHKFFFSETDGHQLNVDDDDDDNKSEYSIFSHRINQP